MFGFLETDIRQGQKYKKGIQLSVDNTVNVENCVKGKNNFLLRETFLFFLKQKYILFLAACFYKVLIKHLITSAFFCRGKYQKHRYASAKASSFADCQGEF